MATTNDHRITSVAQLRSLISEPNAMVRMKVMSELDDLAIDFIKRSPFLVLSTADADGNQDASPKGDHPGFVLVENPTTIVIRSARATNYCSGCKTFSPIRMSRWCSYCQAPARHFASMAWQN